MPNPNVFGVARLLLQPRQGPEELNGRRRQLVVQRPLIGHLALSLPLHLYEGAMAAGAELLDGRLALGHLLDGRPRWSSSDDEGRFRRLSSIAIIEC